MTGRTAPDWLTQWEYAHRGLHGNGIPENSLEGARRAIAAGMGIECDIQRSADGSLMVFHDWDLLRLTGTEGLTEGRTALELRELRYLDSDESPATLSDLLGEVNGQAPLLIEIKSKRGYDVEHTCKLVAEALANYRGPHAVMSFDPRVSRWFRRSSTGTPYGLVMREDEHGYTQQAWQRRLAFAIARPQFLAYHIAALPNPWVAGLRAKGLPVLTWTVNSPETRARALTCTDALISEGAGLA
ncbi:glycerophosphodiester phosphodiesterase family protein [Altererythrobacter arenosus]|uniref:Glycerophosphodiester phosphodiesterase family protein n=1 Tax=Altererythrobacter arenosus TaxID=3032592 RepID=A0ABY8FZU9_9SPHN|nr:glycerophosphodiester phosphodiesterase family protein [Altererythrobacter sp. CAU 1644]WFL78861.1 glycerophosphodiester phosphodiesterase family protein [Altererythrobacter sp. CAU 1644]